MIMKKVWLVLLATVLVFGLVVSCGGSSSDDDKEEEEVDNAIDLGDASFSKGTGDTDNAESQAYWEIEDADKYAVLAAAGTKLVVTFENVIEGGMSLIWQAHDGTTYGGWEQKQVVENSGAETTAAGATLSNSSKTLTIDLSKGLKDYDVEDTGFLAKTGENKKAKIIVAYYTGATKMRGLNPKSAKLVPGA